MSTEVEITIKELQLNGTTAIRIMRCLKKYEPEIWTELKNSIKQKLPIHGVGVRSELLCIHKWMTHDDPVGGEYCVKCQIDRV